jgi:hypothetical protein
MKTLITKYILILLGFILTISFIWFRFIKERLPREIPFDLSLIGFVLLVFACFTYTYMIITILFNYNPTSNSLSSIVQYIYKPLTTLDEAIKTNSIIKPYYEKFLVYIVTHTNGINYFKVYLVFDIIPRIILVSALLIDTFYYHCLFLLYKVIIVSLLLFLGRYIKYSFTYAKEQYILQLEPMVDYIMSNYVDPEDELAASGNLLSNLSVRRFIDIQVDAIVYGSKEYTYRPFGWHTEYIDNFRKLHNLSESYTFTSKEFDLLRVDFKNIIKIVIPLSVHLEEYSVQVEYSKYRKRKSIIFTLYLVCWLFILIVSIPSLSLNTFNPIFDIVDTFEPFSGLDITCY